MSLYKSSIPTSNIVTESNSTDNLIEIIKSLQEQINSIKSSQSQNNSNNAPSNISVSEQDEVPNIPIKHPNWTSTFLNFQNVTINNRLLYLSKLNEEILTIHVVVYMFRFSFNLPENTIFFQTHEEFITQISKPLTESFPTSVKIKNILNTIDQSHDSPTSFNSTYSYPSNSTSNSSSSSNSSLSDNEMYNGKQWLDDYFRILVQKQGLLKKGNIKSDEDKNRTQVKKNFRNWIYQIGYVIIK